jgi:hypothetical protein
MRSLPSSGHSDRPDGLSCCSEAEVKPEPGRGMRTGMGPRKSGGARYAALPLHTLARSRQVPRPAAGFAAGAQTRGYGPCPAGPELEGAPSVAGPAVAWAAGLASPSRHLAASPPSSRPKAQGTAPV